MFSKFIELVRQAIKKMVGYKDVSETIEDTDVEISISSAMKDAVALWRNIYKDKSPWLDEENGIYSLQLGKTICQGMRVQTLSEMTSEIVSKTDVETANILNYQYQNHVLTKLGDEIEKGMALGSLIMKPYVVNDNIYIDFCVQGTFVPIAYDDDGNIIDVVFPDIYTVGDTVYTRLERQTFNAQEKKIVIENKCYKSDKKEDEDDNQRLGQEVELETVSKWSDIEPIVTIEDVEKSLFGYYKVPLTNNIDLDSPLGISVFSPAVNMIQRADEQFSRLDWEYEGGQMAIDVDDTALHSQSTYFGGQSKTRTKMDRTRNRLYRRLDLGAEDTYNVFAPNLRDASYLEGLDKYLTKIEDNVGLARGMISSVESEARTATEIKILKQKTFITIKAHQTSIQHALEDLVYAMSVIAKLYKITKTVGDCEVNTDWKDSILTDTQEELNQKLQLVGEGILGKAEVRAWYTGEDLETAQDAIDNITEPMLDDLYSTIE